MLYQNLHALVAAPYWRWREYTIYEYKQLFKTNTLTRENNDFFKCTSKTT